MTSTPPREEPRRILITGASGRLGSVLFDSLDAAGHSLTGADKDELDITDYAAVREFVVKAAPEIVIHAAAWTDVDACALDPERALLVNGYGAGNVAAAAAERGAEIVYISSNEVFSGQDRRAYYEHDTPAPANAYGSSKLAGERAVSAVNPRHYIVRTAWLFAHGGANFIQAILGAAAAGKSLRVVTDEIANPTYNADLAAAITELVAVGRWGTYHLTNSGTCSRYKFARYALDRAGYAALPVQPIIRHEWPRASTPPEHTPLANLNAAAAGVTLRPWQEAVDAFLTREGLLVTDDETTT